MKLESLRYIVSHLERVVVVRSTYTLFSLGTFVLSRSSVEEEELLEIIR